MLTRILRYSFMFAAAGTLAAQTPAPSPADAKPAAPVADGKQKPPAEPFPNLGLLHRDDDASVLNEFWVLGRYHGQYHWANGGAEDDEGWENRRFRLGTQFRMFKNLTVHAQSVSGNDPDDFDPEYNGFTELWAGWRFDDAFMLTIGQQKHRFTHDRNVSSRYLSYLERSQLTNMFRADYTPAVTGSGRIGAWSYYAGVFTNKTSDHMDDSFTDLDSGESLLATVTRDLGDAFGTDTAFLNVSGVHSEANDNATNLNYFEDGVASALILTDGPASLVTEVTAGLGNDAGDAYGLNLQPTLFLTDKFQLATRYQYAWSDGDQGLRAQSRYERLAGMNRGDEYQAAYLGLNHHIAGHRLKVMYGVEHSTLGGQECVTFSVMFRMFFGPHSRGPFPMGDTLHGIWD
jgi:phosphate-selective porin OprO/OprP